MISAALLRFPPTTDVEDLDPNIFRGRIYVTVIRVFKHHILGRETMEFIVVNEKGTRIQVSVYLDDYAKISERLFLGATIYLGFFGLESVKGEFRPTKHKYKINWISASYAIPAKYTGPVFFYEFAEFEDIDDDIYDSMYSVDLIGRVVNVGNFHLNRDTIICRIREGIYFELENPRGYRLRCFLGKDFATDFMLRWDSNQEDINICIVRFAKLRRVQGVWVAEPSIGISEILLNGAQPEVVDTRNAFLVKDPKERPICFGRPRVPKPVSVSNANDMKRPRDRDGAYIIPGKKAHRSATISGPVSSSSDESTSGSGYDDLTCVDSDSDNGDEDNASFS